MRNANRNGSLVLSSLPLWVKLMALCVLVVLGFHFISQLGAGNSNKKSAASLIKNCDEFTCQRYCSNEKRPKEVLASGIPSAKGFANLFQSEVYRSCRSFSDAFVSTNAETTKVYSVKDPFNTWSRVWEYTYVAQAIENYITSSSFSNSKDLKVIDLGAGVVFFPWFLIWRHPDWSVYALDYDKRYPDIYAGINANMREQHQLRSSVQLRIHDLRNMLPFEDNSIDIAYCISVLEHTNQYSDIVREIHRVLKPGGLFVTTFDIALPEEKSVEINIPGAEKLMSVMRAYFSEFTPWDAATPMSAFNYRPVSELIKNHRNDTLTTQFVGSRPEWGYLMSPYTSSLHITCACHTFVKVM